MRRKLLRKRTCEARRDRAVLPRGNVIHRPVVTTDVPVRIETSGLRRSGPTVKNVMMTKQTRQRSRPKGFDTKEIVVISSSLSKADIYRSQSTEFCAREVK